MTERCMKMKVAEKILSGSFIVMLTLLVMPAISMEADDAYVRYQFKSSAESWNIDAACTISVLNGSLIISVSGDDPWIRNDLVYFDANEYTKVGIIMKSRKTNGDIYIRWTTNFDPVFDTAKQNIIHGFNAGDELNYFEIDNKDHPEWKNMITDLKIGFIGGDEIGDVIKVESIVIGSSDNHFKYYNPLFSQNPVYSESSGEYLYNQYPSIEFFNGKYYVAWSGSAIPEGGSSPQYILISQSNDLISWKNPPWILNDPQDCNNALNANEPVEWTPQLYNYHDEELWCIWNTYDEINGSATHIATLRKDDIKWSYRGPVLSTHIVQCSESTYGKSGLGYKFCPTSKPIFASQSKRYIIPGIFWRWTGPHVNDGNQKWVGFIYNNDVEADLLNWEVVPDYVSTLSEPGAVGSATLHIQSDGIYRVFMGQNIPENTLVYQKMCTTTGTDTPFEFNTIANYSHVETTTDRPFTTRLPSGRYLMLKHNTFTYRTDFDSYKGMAFYFSKTGKDNFVAGPFIDDRTKLISSPQAIEHDGKIICIYSTTNESTGNKEIYVSYADAPYPEKKYVYLAAKNKIKYDKYYYPLYIKTGEFETSYPSIEVDNSIIMEDGGRAGVDISDIDFDNGDILNMKFQVKIDVLPKLSSLIIFSFGDKFPVRVGVPSNRPGYLYAYCSRKWHRMGVYPKNQYFNLEVEIDKKKLRARIDDGMWFVCDHDTGILNQTLYIGNNTQQNIYQENEDTTLFRVRLNTFNILPSTQGDFEPDGDVDLDDLAIFASAWLAELGDIHWILKCDISDPVDDIIDMADLSVFSSKWISESEK